MKLYTAAMIGCMVVLYVVVLKAIVFASAHDTWRGLAMVTVALAAALGIVGILALIRHEYEKEEEVDHDDP